MDSGLDYYIKKGNARVDGWLKKIAMKAIVELNGIQDQESIKGPVCEIGVHHGRLFILLHLLTVDPEMSVAWDIFEHQHENPHNSGRGDIDSLMANLHRFDCDLSRINIITKNSRDLEPEEIITECKGKPRLFSIDGGHTAEITYNDIHLASGTICKKGIIILDDFFNEAWPGVAEGTCCYMVENPGLYPVAIVGNKLILTNSKDGAKRYIHNLDFNYPGYIRKHSLFFGHDVLCFTPLNTNIIWKHLRDRPLGKLIKQMFKR